MKIKLFTIPNTITLSNLLCGVGSIVASVVYENLTLAFVLILCAAVCDFFDGFAARILKQYSAIGVQLDSLADMVSFGTAPAFALYTLYGVLPSAFQLPSAATALLAFVPFLIPAFSALRLAKFNIDDSQHEEFCGLTTTANGILCTSLAMILANGDGVVAREWIALIAVAVSLLLVSPIRMFSFKMQSFGWRENRLRYLFIALAVALLFLLRTYAIPVIIVTYIVISTVIWVVNKAK